MVIRSRRAGNLLQPSLEQLRDSNRRARWPASGPSRRNPLQPYSRSAIRTFISSEFAFSSGAYIASATVGRAAEPAGNLGPEAVA